MKQEGWCNECTALFRRMHDERVWESVFNVFIGGLKQQLDSSLFACAATPGGQFEGHGERHV